jgi:uncharacterized SAM-binding protein YcdF (DUF218 family)
MAMQDVDTAGRIIYDYMRMGQRLRKCDAVFVLGSLDKRVPEYGAQLFLDGYGDWLIISGGVGHGNDLLATAWHKTEAELFADIAKRKGVPKKKLILEKRAMNTGQNIQFTYKLLQELGHHFSSLLLVQKPYMERRTYATFKKQWPDPTTNFIVSSPPYGYDDYFDAANPKEKILHIMVGDLQRILEYPKLNFQIEQKVPSEVRDAYEYLVSLGYTKHLIKEDI